MAGLVQRLREEYLALSRLHEVLRVEEEGLHHADGALCSARSGRSGGISLSDFSSRFAASSRWPVPIRATASSRASSRDSGELLAAHAACPAPRSPRATAAKHFQLSFSYHLASVG